LIRRKIKVVIITNNDLFFQTIQKEFLFENLELIYLQVIDNSEKFIQKVNPDILIVNWINDPSLESRLIEMAESIDHQKTNSIFILPEPEEKYPNLKKISTQNVIFYFSPISIHALINNLKNEISFISDAIESRSQFNYLQNLLKVAYQLNTKQTVDEVFESLLANLPKFLPFDFYAVGLFNKQNKQIDIIKQFVPPVSNEFLIVNHEFEQKLIKWTSFKNYISFEKAENHDEIQTFNKLGWNVESVLIYPLKRNYEPIGFLILGKKQGRSPIHENLLGSLEVINRFLVQKIQSILKFKPEKSISLDFVKRIIRSDYNETIFFEEMCNAINQIADTEITIFWQHKKGFHILFPKYYSGNLEMQKINQLLREVIYQEKNPIFQRLSQRQTWKVFDYLFEQPDFSEDLELFKKLGVHHLLVIPLIMDETDLGIFTAISTKRERIISPWNLNEISILMEYSTKILKTIEVVKEAGTKFRQLNKIFELGNEVKLDLKSDVILDHVLQAIRKTLGWNDIIILLYDDSKNFLHPTKHVGFDKNVISNFSPEQTIEDIKIKLIFEESEQIGNSYLYRDKTTDETAQEVASGEWHDSDELIVPIETSRDILGYLILKDPVLRTKPGIDDIQPLEYFANQIAVALENSILFEALRSSEERYRSLAETMPLGVVSCDEKGDIIYFNPKFQDLCNLTDFELEKKNILEYFTPASQKLVKQYIQNLGNKQESQSLKADISQGIELELISPKTENGDATIPVLTFFSDLKASLKEKFIMVFSDIRERKKLEKMRENFNSMIVHDLRSPLNVIQGFIEMLLRQTAGPLTSQQEEFLDTAMENVKKVLNLVDNFLIMSRMKAGRFSLTPQLGDLNNQIRKMVRQFEVVKRKKNLYFKLELSEDIPLIVYDSFRIEQVMNNLLSNAIKYSPENGVIKITTELFREKVNNQSRFFVRVGVQDSGVGIPEKEKDKIFQMYEMAHENTSFKRDGTGLGLAICKEIIEAHKGRIWVDSHYKKGSTFYFILPIPQSKSLLES
jgi:PAS domain S-box-containing protein